MKVKLFGPNLVMLVIQQVNCCLGTTLHYLPFAPHLYKFMHHITETLSIYIIWTFLDAYASQVTALSVSQTVRSLRLPDSKVSQIFQVSQIIQVSQISQVSQVSQISQESQISPVYQISQVPQISQVCKIAQNIRYL